MMLIMMTISTQPAYFAPVLMLVSEVMMGVRLAGDAAAFAYARANERTASNALLNTPSRSLLKRIFDVPRSLSLLVDGSYLLRIRSAVSSHILTPCNRIFLSFAEATHCLHYNTSFIKGQQ